MQHIVSRLGIVILSLPMLMYGAASSSQEQELTKLQEQELSTAETQELTTAGKRASIRKIKQHLLPCAIACKPYTEPDIINNRTLFGVANFAYSHARKKGDIKPENTHIVNAHVFMHSYQSPARQLEIVACMLNACKGKNIETIAQIMRMTVEHRTNECAIDLFCNKFLITAARNSEGVHYTVSRLTQDFIISLKHNAIGGQPIVLSTTWLKEVVPAKTDELTITGCTLLSNYINAKRRELLQKQSEPIAPNPS